MSKLLKVIVNTLLLLAILSAGALVIPPFAGITTHCLRRDGKYQHFPRRCYVRKEDRHVIGCDGRQNPG